MSEIRPIELRQDNGQSGQQSESAGARLPPGSFFGTTTIRRDIGGMTFAESVYRNPMHIPKHEDANAFFNLVLEGTYTEVCHKVPRTRGPFTLVLHPAGEEHADRWHGGGGRVVHVD